MKPLCTSTRPWRACSSHVRLGHQYNVLAVLACDAQWAGEAHACCCAMCADGANPFQSNAEGVTPMDMAISTGQHHLVRLYESKALLRAEVEFKVRGSVQAQGRSSPRFTCCCVVRCSNAGACADLALVCACAAAVIRWRSAIGSQVAWRCRIGAPATWCCASFSCARRALHLAWCCWCLTTPATREVRMGHCAPGCGWTGCLQGTCHQANSTW